MPTNLLTLTIYKITDDPRSLTKDTSGVSNTFRCTPTHDCDVLSPTLSVAYVNIGNGLTPAQANYAYVDAFKRFYFIKDVTYGTGGKVYFHLGVDVLGTYGPLIKECICSVSRSESAGINWVPDDKFPLDTLHTVTKGESSVFSSPFVKDSLAPWIFTVINDNGAVHSTPTTKGEVNGSK